MPNTARPVTTEERVRDRLALAKAAKSKVFYATYVGLTPDPNQVQQAVQIHGKLFPKVCGLKLFAGKSVGDLEVIDEQDSFQDNFTFLFEKISKISPLLYIFLML